ncbi:MAG TPA: phage regulatory CII family protein [Phycisphaerales bacterium]|nr:phage regulatory CII family protein [Phycisphaerales bacterium]
MTTQSGKNVSATAPSPEPTTPLRLCSPDPIVRRDATRAIIGPLMASKAVSAAGLARECDHKPQLFHRMLAMGERRSLPLADLPLLITRLGAEVLEPFAQVANRRLIPIVAHAVEPREMVSATAAMMRECCEAAATASQHTTGMTPAAVAECDREIDEAIRSLLALKASVHAAAVTPIRSAR